MLQLHPLPSLQLARTEVHRWGLHAPALWVSGCCGETAHAVPGFQPISPSCWPLDLHLIPFSGPAAVAYTYSYCRAHGVDPLEYS